MVASLSSLPNELFLMICNELHPPSEHPTGCLQALGALSRTNRRLCALVTPILYDHGVKRHFHLPLLWAAKFNLPATLARALAAGANPNYSFGYLVSRRLWDLANDTQHAARGWSNHEPTYWPPMDYGRAILLRGPDAHWARDMTPDLTHIDVVAPTSAIPIVLSGEPADPADSSSGSGSGSESGHDSNPSSDDDQDDVEFDTIYNWPARDRHDDPDGNIIRGYTALHLAAKEGNNDIVDMLLDHGALIDSLCLWFCDCGTPHALWQTLVAPEREPWSIRAGWPECRHQTPLHIAICSSRPDTAKLLVARGTQAVRGLDRGNSSGHSGLHQAAGAGYTDLVRYILDTHPGLHVDEPDEEGLTPFYYAYANRRWDSTVPLLLARGANVDICFKIRRRFDCLMTTTPLGEACRLGRFEDALRLIGLGADITLGIYQEETTLLGRQDVDDSDDDRNPLRPNIPGTRISLLHVCSMDFSGDSDVYPGCPSVWGPASLQRLSRPTLIARLVAGGLSPDLKWNAGAGPPETPLSLAVGHLNMPAVKALLGAGADVNTRGPHGRSLLMRSVLMPDCQDCEWRFGDPSGGTCPILRCPQSFAKDPGTEHPDRLGIARLLLDAGAPIQDRDAEGNSALHLLFLPAYDLPSPWSRLEDERAQRQLLRLLLSRGADPCSRNHSGKSVLRLVVEEEEREALETISSQCRIDLMDRLPMDEIIAIFAAMPVRYTPGDPRRRRLGRTDMCGYDDDEPWRLPDALLSMDSSGRVASNLPFICRSLMNSKRWASLTELVEILYSRGVDMGCFSPEMKQDLLSFSLQLERWQMAYQLLDELPEVRDINAPVAGNLTPLSLVTYSNFNRANSPAIDIQLVEAGADVHLPLASPLVRGYDVDVGVVTPLKQALVFPDAFHIDWMLRKQPIRGNPQAAEARYLHFAVTLPWRRELPDLARPPAMPWFSRDGGIRALLAAGADTAQLDDEGNTPLSALLYELATDSHYLPQVCHWFKPLSRGLDVNRRNKKGVSVADYLDGFLKLPCTAEILSVYLELVTLEDGKREIKWLK
jgi:ankyrin repeat protein